MKFIPIDPTPKMTVECGVCRDGWPLYVSEDGLHASHSLPEPAGGFNCFADPELIKAALKEQRP